MFQIRAEQFAAMRRKKLGDVVMQRLEALGIAGSWDETRTALLLDDALGHRSRIAFDAQGCIGAFTSPLGRTWRFGNDADGRALTTVSPSGHTLSMTYDAGGGLASLASSTRAPMQIRNAALRQPVAFAFADGTTSGVERNWAGQIVRFVDRNGSQTVFEYDDRQRLTAIVDGNGNRTGFGYGEARSPVATRFANGTGETYAYDAAGKLAEVAQGDVTIRVTCDDKARPVQALYSDGTEVRFAYDDRGRITSAAVGDLESKVAYDERGHVVEEATGDARHAFAYDALGRLIAIADGGGETVAYEWDADSRLSGFTDWNGGVHRIEYAAADRGALLRGANGVQSFTGYEASGRVARVAVVSAGQTLYARALRYDAEERVGSAEDSVTGDAGFSYDPEGQLLRVRTAVAGLGGDFMHDRGGNITQIDGAPATLDAANQLLAQGAERMAYDSRGNMVGRRTAAGDWRYRYNARNQMIASFSPAGVETTYAYDGFGRRQWKRTGARSTRFVWAAERLVGEVTTDEETGAVRRQDYLYEPLSYVPLATRIDGAVYLYHGDQLGTPRALTSPAGEVVWLAEYTPLGAARIAVERMTNPLRFAGQYFDVETGLHYNRFRYYAPELGRYTTRDPIGVLGGTNLYRYADNDPINRTDPLGLWSWTGAGVGLVAGAAGVAVTVGLCALCGPEVAPFAAMVGAGVANAVSNGLNEALKDQQFSPACIAKAAVVGYVTGIISAIPTVLAAVGGATLGPVGYVVAGAVGGGIAGGLSYTLGYYTQPVGTRGNFSWGQFGVSAGLGAASGATGAPYQPNEAPSVVSNLLGSGGSGGATGSDPTAPKAANLTPPPGSVTGPPGLVPNSG